MAGQSVGSMICALEALSRARCHIFWDTTGHAFAVAMAKLCWGMHTAAYVHYPTITTEMLDQVQAARPTYNNDTRIAGSVTATTAKLLYYKAFAAAYRLAGGCIDLPMGNSTWTCAHLRSLWGAAHTHIPVVYPPCAVQELCELPLRAEQRAESRLVVSIAQFRPEKDHRLQLHALAELRNLGTCAAPGLCLAAAC